MAAPGSPWGAVRRGGYTRLSNSCRTVLRLSASTMVSGCMPAEQAHEPMSTPGLCLKSLGAAHVGHNTRSASGHYHMGVLPPRPLQCALARTLQQCLVYSTGRVINVILHGACDESEDCRRVGPLLQSRCRGLRQLLLKLFTAELSVNQPKGSATYNSSEELQCRRWRRAALGGRQAAAGPQPNIPQRRKPLQSVRCTEAVCKPVDVLHSRRVGSGVMFGGPADLLQTLHGHCSHCDGLRDQNLCI